MHIIHSENVLTYIEYTPTFNGLNVTEFGEETNERCSGLLCYRRNHILHFVLEGTGTFYRDGNNYPLSAGKAFVITPKNLVRYEADKGTSWKYCWVAFSGTDCETLFAQCGLTAKNAVFSFDKADIAPLRAALEIIRNGMPANAPAFQMQVSSMAFEVLSNCAARLRPAEHKTEGLSSSIVDTAVAYIQANLFKPMNVSTICKELNVSRTYFSTLFETVMQQTPYRYLQNQRIQRASELLLSDSNLRIYEVAEICGFASTAQFCKSFRKLLNYSPSEFREKYRKDEK